MTLDYNKNLSRLAVDSKLAQSAIPVIVCDEKFLVCMISHGARKLYFPMQLGKNMFPLFPQSMPDMLKNTENGVFVSELNRGSDRSTALIVSDKLQGEQYHAIVILPQIMFSHASAPWYINEAFDNLHQAVNELISSQRTEISRLDLCCARLSTLFSFLQEPRANIILSKYASPSIYRQINEIVTEAGSVFAKINGTLSAKYADDVSFTTQIHPRYINILSTTLLSLLLLSSSNANVYLSANIKRGRNGSMTFSHTAVTSLVDTAPIDSLDELRHRLSYLAPELAAIQDLAERLDISLSCKTEGNTLTVSYKIPICTVGSVVFHENDANSSKRVSTLASTLIGDFLQNGKKLP